MHPIIDLHCDLLSFLAEHPSRTTKDPLSRASYPQMLLGGVKVQTLAVFTETTPQAFTCAKKQLAILDALLEKEAYRLFDPSLDIQDSSPYIYVLPAFENACGFADEQKPIQEGLLFLETLLQRYKRFLYISLTWDGENRFGGGVGTKIGLKDDGKQVLDWMDQKDIALDFSHASDSLADAILNYVDKKSLKIPLLASHSNARAITPLERNLPDFLIKEIFTRKGLVGLNFFAPFIGDSSTRLLEHIMHFFSLGGEHQLCFGADFFPDFTLSAYLQKKYGIKNGFFSELGNASTYPKLLSFLQPHLSSKQLQGLAFKNFSSFLSD